MASIDGYRIEKVEPIYFIQQAEMIVWPVDPDQQASKHEAEAMLPAFPGGKVVACELVLKK